MVREESIKLTATPGVYDAMEQLLTPLAQDHPDAGRDKASPPATGGPESWPRCR